MVPVGGWQMVNPEFDWGVSGKCLRWAQKEGNCCKVAAWGKARTIARMPFLPEVAPLSVQGPQQLDALQEGGDTNSSPTHTFPEAGDAISPSTHTLPEGAEENSPGWSPPQRTESWDNGQKKIHEPRRGGANPHNAQSLEHFRK
jgi:hypothetical protein